MATHSGMTPLRISFDFLDKDDNDPVGYKDITCHLIFNVKTDLTRKTRYVAGGNITYPPLSMTYIIMVSGDSVHTALLIA